MEEGLSLVKVEVFMSLLDRFSNAAGGGWRVGNDCNIQFSAKTFKASPSTRIQVKIEGRQVTSQSFLKGVIDAIEKDPQLSDKLKKLKDNESIKVIIGKNGVEYELAKAAKHKQIVERVERASSATINKPALGKGPPPPINRNTKPKPQDTKQKEPMRQIADPANRRPPPQSKQAQKKEAEREADIWRRLEEDGEVDLG